MLLCKCTSDQKKVCRKPSLVSHVEGSRQLARFTRCTVGGRRSSTSYELVITPDKHVAGEKIVHNPKKKSFVQQCSKRLGTAMDRFAKGMVIGSYREYDAAKGLNKRRRSCGNPWGYSPTFIMIKGGYTKLRARGEGEVTRAVIPTRKNDTKRLGKKQVNRAMYGGLAGAAPRNTTGRGGGAEGSRIRRNNTT